MANQLLSVVDQGFEAGVGTWVAFTNCAVAQTAAQAQAGTKSLAMTSSAGGTMSAKAGLVPVMPGRNYTGSAWFRSAVSARTCTFKVGWIQSDGVTNSTITASSFGAGITDSTSAWTQDTTFGTVAAPADAFYALVQAIVAGTGAGAEVHYVDTVSFTDVSAPFFKAGRLTEILHGTATTAQDVSAFFYSAQFNTYLNTAEVSTFKSTYKSYLAGEAFSQFFGYGYYDPTLTAVRLSLQATPGVLNYAPAGATAIGDQVRLQAFNTVDYKESASTSKAVAFTWQADSTSAAGGNAGQVGYGVTLHPLASENVGTITGTGDPVMTGVAGTGLVAHLHVTGWSAGTQNFKLQDATALNAAYTDIAGGAFTAQAAVGAQRLIITGTVRAYVRAVATIATAACTYSIAVARYPT